MSCYYQYFLHRVLILQCPWKEKIGCQYKAESTIITCLEINISFSQMTSSFHSSVNMLFSYILKKKKKKCYFGCNKSFFFFFINIVRSHKTWVIWFFSSILHHYREEHIVKRKFPSSRHYSIMKSHFSFNKNNPWYFFYIPSYIQFLNQSPFSNTQITGNHFPSNSTI